MTLKYIDRRNTDCFKWDGLADTFGADGLLPLWVADMDFGIDDNIIEAMQEYIAQGVPGYYWVPDSYFDAFIKWEKEEHGLDVKREWIRFSPGVVTGFHFAVQMLTEPGDSVIVNTPVYYPFMNAVENNGRKLVTSGLVSDNGRYTIDFEDFEKKITENDVKLFILCSPHNPVSRVWHEDELSRLLDICRRHGIAVVSDEIHHDLVFGDICHVPTLTLAGPEDRIIMMTAASKTFNLAGLQNSFIVIRNEELRAKWDRFTTANRIQSGNPLGYIAVKTAYEKGKPWLDEVKKTIYGNYEALSEALRSGLKDAVISPLEGTYLAWLDFSAYLSPEEIKPFMQEKCGLAFDYGEWFVDRNGDDGIASCCVRINLATSRENVMEAVNRIIGSMVELTKHD